MLLGLMQSGILLAQGDGGGSLLVSLMPLMVIFYLFYLLFIRPQKKEQDQRKSMLAEMKKNDKIVTVGGIIGVVTNVDRDKGEVTIKTDESGGKLRMTLGSINRVVVDDPSKLSST